MGAVGLGIYAAIVAVRTTTHKQPQNYKQLIFSDLKLMHVTVEVNNGHLQPGIFPVWSMATINHRR
jgi:hypothetical protein